MADGSDEPMGRRESDVAMALVAHRIGDLEKAVVKLGSQIDNLRFVPQNVYDANQVTANQTHEILAKNISQAEKRLTKEIDDVRKLAIWALSTIGVALLGAVVAGIGRLAGL